MADWTEETGKVGAVQPEMPEAPAEDTGGETLFLPSMVSGMDKLKPGDKATVTLEIRVAQPSNSAAGGSFTEGAEVEILSGKVGRVNTVQASGGGGSVPVGGNASY